MNIGALKSTFGAVLTGWYQGDDGSKSPNFVESLFMGETGLVTLIRGTVM